MPQLHEQYRPKAFAEVVGQRHAIKQIATLSQRGLGGRAYFISGKSGTGKTTIAQLIAAEVADEFGIDDLDASTITVKDIQDIERRMSRRCLGEKGGHAVIINEAHGLRKDTIRQLLVTLERIPEWGVWIFTTTIEGQESLFEDHIDAHPLLSRCIVMPLRWRNVKKDFAERCREIATNEGLNGRPIEAYIGLAEDCKCNMRAMLQRIESGEMMPASVEDLFDV